MPDVAVVVGNDQMEVFTAEHIPAFAIFWGDYVEGIPRTPGVSGEAGPRHRPCGAGPDPFGIHPVPLRFRPRPPPDS